MCLYNALPFSLFSRHTRAMLNESRSSASVALSPLILTYTSRFSLANYFCRAVCLY